MLNTINKKTNGIKAYKEWPCVTLIVKGQKLGLGPFLAWGDFYALAFRSLYYP